MSGRDPANRRSANDEGAIDRRLVAVLDACVLFAATPRDVLLELAAAGLYRPRWTERIHAEWTTSLSRVRPDIAPAKIDALRRAIDASAPDCLVDGYQPLVSRLSLPDAEDRHVLAAAIHCDADLVVTFNIRDFPKRQLAPYGLSAESPDRFILRLIAIAPDAVCEGLRRMRGRLRNPGYEAEELLDLIARRGLPQTARKLRPRMERL
jgi:hypothetical protein